ncbi:MAG: hypothetical protein JO040_07650 [Gemmatimonadetes bacterium]|nr:hypothetical protein [Gemmatimonadota bacterium]
MKRNFLAQVPVMGMLAFAAACGGGDKPADNGAAGGDASTQTAEAPAAAPAAEQTPAAAPASGNVVEVHMKTTNGGASGVFEPAEVTAKKGDILRFISDGGAAHNADFANDPDNAGKAGLPGPTPFATTPGQTVDIPVTMDAGTYSFQCDPHAAMGMKGKLTVQ